MQLVDSDRDLVHACLAGDRAAWETLIHRYEQLIYSVPVRNNLSKDDAADVFQTVCLKLFENLAHLRHQDRLAGWLLTTASRESWRVQREGRRHTVLSEIELETSDGDAPDELPAADPSPHEVVVRREEEQMVRQAMEELGERCRKLLTLLYYTEPAPSYAEVARRMEMSEGSIGPTRARCLQQLREILERKGF